MKLLLNTKGSWAYRSLMLLAAFSLVFGLWSRFYNLSFPPQHIWDEKFFPVYANDYLHGIPFFDLHPPLGKFIIAISIAIFGNTPFGWRLMPYLFGCAMVVLGVVLGWYYLKDRVAALLLGSFIAIETMFIVYSRTGLMDGILVFFVLATLLSAVWAERKGQVIWPSVLLGLSISVKWAVFGLAFPVGYILWRKKLFRPFLGGLWVSAIVYVLIVYVGQIVNGGGNLWVAWKGVLAWHLQSIRNISMAFPNDWASPWWSWPLMLRPMGFYQSFTASGDQIIIMAIGNPLLWWSSTLAVAASLVELVYRGAILRKNIADHPLVPVLIGYVFLLLPWIPAPRIPFIYNYFPSYAFALLALVSWLCRIWNRRTWGPWAVVAFTGCAVALTLFFLPMILARPMTNESVNRHIWLSSWSR
ncbi:MAG: phospholipid carrier-dependent glycosyltransferase [Rubrobacteraceae bacterium]